MHRCRKKAQYDPRTEDRLAIRELIENWAVLRDARLWDDFRKVWHDDGVMQATWFQGTATNSSR